MQSGLASSLIETGFTELQSASNLPTLLNGAEIESRCLNGVCSIDSGFVALLRNSKGKLTVVASKEARNFDFNSPKLV